MRVILQKDIKGFGAVGDEKTVSDGYARNFLIPRGFAVAATAKAIKDAEATKDKKDRRRSEIEALIKSIEEGTALEPIVFGINANKSGVFGAVTDKLIKKELEKIYPRETIEKIAVEKTHIKTLGVYKVKISYGNVSGYMTLDVRSN